MLEWLEPRRLLSAGDPDPAFGPAGIASVVFDNAPSSAEAVVVPPGGKNVAAGSARTASAGEVAVLARFNADGSPDNSFSSDGKIAFGTTGNDTDFSRGRALALQSDGKILVLAEGAPGVFVLRYDSSGALD